jgi:hypothetical protein
MTQNIIVGIIVLLAVIFVIKRIYRNIRHANDPCYGCGGCEIHRQLMEKRKTCNKNKHSNCKK